MEHLLFAINKRNNRQPKSFEDILNRHLKTCLEFNACSCSGQGYGADGKDYQ